MGYVSVNVGQAEISAAVTVSQLFVIEAQQVKHCCMKIMYVHPIFNGVDAKFVGCTVNMTSLYAAAAEPGCETRVVMVAAF